MTLYSDARTGVSLMRVLVLVPPLAVLFTARAATAAIIVDLGTFGGESFPRAVNASGQVVGEGTIIPGDLTRTRAFSWTQTDGMIDLDTFAGSISSAFAVNNSGQVVGGSAVTGRFDVHAFWWTQESGMIDLGTLGGTFSNAFAVNASGQVVGYSETAEPSIERDAPARAAAHAVLWSLVDGVPTCCGRLATIFVRDGRIVVGPDDGKPYRGCLRGTQGDDVIVATEARDVIRSFGGNVWVMTA